MYVRNASGPNPRAAGGQEPHIADKTEEHAALPELWSCDDQIPQLLLSQ